MPGFLAHIRFAALALAVIFLIGVAVPAQAQQPNSVNPSGNAVKEEQLLNALQGGGNVSGRISIPDKKESVLIQPGGRDWQAFHQITLKWIGAISILGMLLLLVGFYLFRGMVRIERGRSGRTIVRFNAAERFVHWMTATCFIILAISGLNITFGKSLLLPLMSPGAFTTWSQALKYAHNYLSFPFTFGVILMFLMWIGGNIPSKADVEWVKRGGGIVGDDHPPAPRFNAGQKMIYWIVVIGGSAVAISGYLLMFPFYGTGIAGMQLAQIVHGIVALLFVAAMLGHIYIGTIGMEGAFEAMGTGEVDVNWAKEHHSLWFEQEMSGDRSRGAAPRATPAE
jgi:formate dehydrogenase subunit gamma